MDGDAFFVACEVAKNPKLKGLAIVTGEERGIVSALSYEAKALGIVRGMPIFKLKREFPSVLILPGDYATYATYSSLMFDIVRRYADDVEEYSIDECFADLTGLERPLKMTYRQIAERIKQEVIAELDLSVSVGLSTTKVLAKVASKWKKPNGFTEIKNNDKDEFLKNTPVEKIWGIGRRTGWKLNNHGIFTALDFVKKGADWVRENFSKPYQIIWYELCGKSLLHVDNDPKRTYSSIQRTRSFHPSNNDKVFLLSQLSKNIEEACRKARHYDLMPKKISFFLKNKDFRYSSLELILISPTNTPEMLMSEIHRNFHKVYDARTLYRTTGITLHELGPGAVKQLDLFGGGDVSNKFEKIHSQIDSLEKKFGRNIVYLGSTHNAKKQKKKGTDVDDLDRDLLFL